MGFAKRQLDRTYVKLSDLVMDGFKCEAAQNSMACGCNGGPAFAMVTDGNGHQFAVCAAATDIDGALCGSCLEEIAGMDFIIGIDGAPVLACPGCEAAFYE